MSVQFDYVARSDVGLLRSNNQDSGYAGQHLLVVADGMGGPAGGDIASSVVVGDLAPLDDDTIPADQMLESLREALQAGHDELIERSVADPALRGLGTTCVAVLRSGNKLAMVHIGDSRAYLLRDGKLIQVTRDHSLVQFLVDSGQITPEEAHTHPKRSVILRVVGDSPGPVEADETVRTAVLGDRWLLCSDGLSGVVSDETIAAALSGVEDLEQCADSLIELALLGGAPDNVTCVLADVVPGGEDVSSTPQVVGAAAVERSRPARPTGGAASRAAALVNGETGADAPAEEDPGGGKTAVRKWLYSLGAALLVAAIGAGLWLGWTWSQTQYFVLATDGNVVVYRGIPQKVGSFELGSPLEVTDIRLSDLPTVDQKRLEEPVVRPSRDAINEYLDELRSRGAQSQRPATRAPTNQEETQQSAKDTPSEGGS